MYFNLNQICQTHSTLPTTQQLNHKFLLIKQKILYVFQLELNMPNSQYTPHNTITSPHSWD